MLCRLLKKPGRRSRKKKMPNLSNTPIVKAVVQPNNSIKTDTQAISTNDISKKDDVEISSKSVMSVKQCNEPLPPTEAMSADKEIISTNETCASSVISKEVDTKSTKGFTSSNEPINSGDVNTANSSSDELVDSDTPASVLAKAVNTANSSSEEVLDGDTVTSVPAEAVEVESVQNDENCDGVTDKETPSISDGEILSDSENENPDESTSRNDRNVLTHQSSSRRSSQSGQSRHQDSHHTDRHGQFDYSGRQSEIVRSRLHDHLDSQDKIKVGSITSLQHSQHHDHSYEYQSSSEPHSPVRSHDSRSRDSSKLLHHSLSRSHDSSKRLHRDVSESQDFSSRSSHTSSKLHRSSKRLYHSLSESHDSSSRSDNGSHDPTKRLSDRSHDLRSRHASSGSHQSSNRERHYSSTSRDLRSHDPSKRSHHHSSGSHDIKLNHVSSKSLHSSRSHPVSNRSHDPLKSLHHSSSGPHDSKSGLHNSHSSSKIMCQNSNGSHVEKFSSTTSCRSPQCSSTSNQSKRGVKRHSCSHGSRDTPIKRNKLTHSAK